MKLAKILATAGMALTLAACSNGGGASSSAAYKAGTYTGTGTGNNGEVKVDVTFSDSAITDIKVSEHQETAGISDGAIEKIPTEIMDAQSLKVDTVSGATNTSNAIIDAVADAVTQAGGDANAMK